MKNGPGQVYIILGGLAVVSFGTTAYNFWSGSYVLPRGWSGAISQTSIAPQLTQTPLVTPPAPPPPQLQQSQTAPAAPSTLPAAAGPGVGNNAASTSGITASVKTATQTGSATSGIAAPASAIKPTVAAADSPTPKPALDPAEFLPNTISCGDLDAFAGWISQTQDLPDWMIRYRQAKADEDKQAVDLANPPYFFRSSYPTKKVFLLSKRWRVAEFRGAPRDSHERSVNIEISIEPEGYYEVDEVKSGIMELVGQLRACAWPDALEKAQDDGTNFDGYYDGEYRKNPYIRWVLRSRTRRAQIMVIPIGNSPGRAAEPGRPIVKVYVWDWD